jgi:VIT1/CCC1 family predicted Fe2+/Mn2+ transporter
VPTAHHVEQHFRASATVRDIVIGMSDGLTVPFALAAGLTGITAATGIVVTGGLAEIAAGAISMGLGGYLAAKTDLEHYQAEQTREMHETQTVPEEEAEEVAAIFRGYGLSAAQVAPVVEALKARPKQWVDFMMRFELGLEEPQASRARRSALTIALSYVIGGMIPLAPYLVAGNVQTGLQASVAVTLIALFAFGYVKGWVTGSKPVRAGLRTLLIGGLAAGAAFIIAKLIS